MIKLKDILNEEQGPCWKGYQQLGMKDKGGKQVPNCVPESVGGEKLVESNYRFGELEYTAKKLNPSEIQDLALAYHQTPITKLAGKNIDHRIRTARDLGRLVGKSYMNPIEKGKEPALLLFLHKNKLVNIEEYKELYNGLFDKLKKISKYVKNADPATRMDPSAKAAAKADMKESILNEKIDTSSAVNLIKSAARNNVKSVDITLKSPKSMGEWDEMQKKFNVSLWPDKLLQSIKKDMDTEKELSFDIVNDATEIIDLIKNDFKRIKNIKWK